MADLISALGLPVILVARPGLGTLNHTLLSLEALRRRGVRVAGVVMNAAHPGTWGAIERSNAETIERMGRTAIIARIPFLAGAGRGLPPAAFVRRMSGCFPDGAALWRLLRPKVKD